jgi:hypothetical protein
MAMICYNLENIDIRCLVPKYPGLLTDEKINLGSRISFVSRQAQPTESSSSVTSDEADALIAQLRQIETPRE